jgi:hypothetical protein
VAGKPDRISVLRALAGIVGVYVPSLYEPSTTQMVAC